MTTTSTTERKATLACASCGRLNRVDLARAGDGPKCGACGTPFALDRPVPLTDETFEAVVTGTTVPVLVDFYADWCSPCRSMAPDLDAVARARAGHALVAKVDVDRVPETPQRFGIRNIPTLVVFRDGREVERRPGAIPRRFIEAMLDRAG